MSSVNKRRRHSATILASLFRVGLSKLETHSEGFLIRMNLLDFSNSRSCVRSEESQPSRSSALRMNSGVMRSANSMTSSVGGSFGSAGGGGAGLARRDSLNARSSQEPICRAPTCIGFHALVPLAPFLVRLELRRVTGHGWTAGQADSARTPDRSFPNELIAVYNPAYPRASGAGNVRGLTQCEHQFR